MQVAKSAGQALKCQPLSRIYLCRLVASLLGFGVRRHDDALIRATRRAVSRFSFWIFHFELILPRPLRADTWEHQARHCSASARGLTRQVATHFASYVVTLCRDSQKDSCASRPNCRETSPFPDPTSLRCTARSEVYTGQRDYAARLRCVPSVRKTGRTHSADHLCLTPRRQAAHRAARRPPTP